MTKRGALIATLWLAGVVLVGTGVTAALIAAGHSLFGSGIHALSETQVRQDLAEQRAANPARQATSSQAPGSAGQGAGGQEPGTGPASTGPASTGPASTAAGAPSARRFTGGTVFASCAGPLVTLTQWSPAQGYQIDDVSAGPATSASVTFKSGSVEQVITATCAAGQPRLTSVSEQAGSPDDHGGGRGGGGGRNGGGGDG